MPMARDGTVAHGPLMNTGTVAENAVMRLALLSRDVNNGAGPL